MHTTSTLSATATAAAALALAGSASAFDAESKTNVATYWVRCTHTTRPGGRANANANRAKVQTRLD